jgi:hypothetical protein
MYGVTPRHTGELPLTGYLSPWLDLPFLKITREVRAFNCDSRQSSRLAFALSLAPKLRRWNYESHVVFYVPSEQGVLNRRTLHDSFSLVFHTVGSRLP